MGEFANRRLFRDEQELVWQSQQPVGLRLNGKGGADSAWQTTTIRPHMMKSIRAYIDYGTPVGSFLRAVIAHDLFQAFAQADEANSVNLYAFVDYFHNEAPSACHGSQQIYQVWQEKHIARRDAAGEGENID